MRVRGFNVDTAHRPNNLSRRWFEASTLKRIYINKVINDQLMCVCVYVTVTSVQTDQTVKYQHHIEFNRIVDNFYFPTHSNKNNVMCNHFGFILCESLMQIILLQKTEAMEVMMNRNSIKIDVILMV